MLRFSIVSCFLAVAACSANGGEDPFPSGPGDPNASGGGGPVFMGGAGNAGTGVTQRIGDSCYANVSQGEHVPLDLYIMFDQSLSMSCATPSGGTRWGDVKAALSSFVQDPAASGIGVGIQYFGQGTTPFLSSCDVADYLNADVEIALLPPNAQPIIDSLGRHGPGTNTPTPVAIQGAAQHALTWKNANPGHTVAVILVTDGQPNACGDLATAVSEAQKAAGSGIPVYVIGVISPGLDCGILDPNPPNQPDLDSLANAGGTAHAFMVDASQNAEQQFLQQMNQIRGDAQVPCQFQIPQTSGFDPTKVNVQFTDASGNPTLVYGVGSSGACDPANGGWYFEGAPSAPTGIDLCPSTCQTVTTTVGITVNVALGCPTMGPH